MPLHDGGTVATAKCLSGLAAAGAEVTLLAMRTGKHRPAAEGEQPPPYLRACHTVDIDTTIKPSALLANLLFSRKPYDLQRFISPRYVEALTRLIRENSFDLVHCEGLPFALYAGMIRNLTGAPLVLRAHNLEHRIRYMMAATASSPARRAYLRILARRLRVLEEKAGSLFDAIVPISQPDRQWFADVTHNIPIFLSETGMDSAAVMAEPDGPPLRVGFIGAMNWGPNLDGLRWLIREVWPDVIKRIPEASLHLAGQGIDTIAGEMPGGQAIHIAGEPEDALRFMASCHLIVIPLFAGSGLRIRIIEAMSIGRPVVATPAAAEGAAACDGRELTVAADAGSFSNAIIRYLTSRQMRAAAAAHAVQLVRERYDNRKLTGELLRFYQGLTDGK